jgi:O-Antigen ligase
MRIILTPRIDKANILALLALSATAVIWNTNPFFVWGYEVAIFALAGIECFKLRGRVPAVAFPMAAIGLWGFVQLLAGATVYRWATINAALQNAALAATALAAFQALRPPRRLAIFLRGVGWIGFVISLVGVLAYWTSPGKILWIYPTEYPDNWGPFPSRNNFAQFLELCFPVALYQSARTSRGWGALIAPAAILAAGLASASRAGAALLAGEALVGLYLIRGSREIRAKMSRTRVLVFTGGVLAFAAVAGAGTLAHRLAQRDPLQVRREIYSSAMAMIAQRPWLGYGLGTFATVYPEFAEFDSGATVEHAHNDWLEWTAEGGIFYAAMWAAMVIWAVRPALRSVWGLGVLAVFLHALVDYPFARVGVSAWAFLLMGALAREAEKSPRRELLSKAEGGEVESAET